MGKLWHFIEASNGFEEYKSSWRKLWESIGQSHPLLDYDFVYPLIEYFGSKKLYLALAGKDGKKGMALVKKKALGIWETFTPGPSPMAMIMIDENQEKKTYLLKLLKDLPGFNFLLGIQRIDPDYKTIPRNAHDTREKQMDYAETIRLKTKGSFEDYWQTRSKNLKGNIKKKTNRIIKEGIASTFKEITCISDIHNGVNTYGELESKGWKGEKGSAVNIDNRLGKFYVDMLENFASKNAAHIYQLLFDDHVVASCLSIAGGGMHILLKITYDEDYEVYSPGWIMMYEIHKKLFDNEENCIEYYATNASQRQKQWTKDSRIIYHMNYFRWSLLKKLYTKIKK